VHPRRRVQEALRAASVDYDTQRGASGSGWSMHDGDDAALEGFAPTSKLGS
jgi:hypothetical protein